ncbi:hypothetical protein [Halorussus sp. MSC15.2]|uniref:hypothetical protein n=1 Tax=Halorussus sp. MSC15.2 TaxID=2283638 RepID=UPI0013D852E8|nr:hypothetical protein [Halorussus sp. MSC15.2]NEU58985.1 hypothetical protein [Halorussus sp. MSC15.2]
MRSLYDHLRNPDHTGERRCWPCTSVNAVLLLAACAGVARRRSRALATVLGVGGAAAIALRGYLVPYTPRFAPGLAARLPTNVFHADRGDGRGTPDASGSLGDDESGEAVLAALVDTGAVVADGETVTLDDDFREAWRAEIRDLRERDDEALAAALRAAAPEGRVVEVVTPSANAPLERDGDRWFVVSDGGDDPANEKWLTRPVAVAETAAVRALADDTDLSATRRAQAAGPLRTVLERCPVCDGPVVETTVVECCGGPGGARPDAPDEVLACDDCGARLYTFQ